VSAIPPINSPAGLISPSTFSNVVNGLRRERAHPFPGMGLRPVSLTERIESGIAPLGTSIARLAVVAPLITLLVAPRFSAENSVPNVPDVTASTSVSIPIDVLKYKNA
jgi:hypothetical protein